MGEGVSISSMTLGISWDQVPKPPSFEIGSKWMFIGVVIVQNFIIMKQTKLELRNHTLCLAYVNKTTIPNIICNWWNMNHKLDGKPKEKNQMKFFLQNWIMYLKWYFKKVMKSKLDLILQAK